MLIAMPTVIPSLLTLLIDFPLTRARYVNFVTEVASHDQFLIVWINYIVVGLLQFLLFLDELDLG